MTFFIYIKVCPKCSYYSSKQKFHIVFIYEFDTFCLVCAKALYATLLENKRPTIKLKQTKKEDKKEEK